MGLDLTGRLGLNNSGFAQGLKESERMAARSGAQMQKALGGALGAVGLGQFLSVGGAVAGVLGLGKAIVGQATHIKDLSEQYGLSIQQVQELDVAAKKSGLTFEDLARPLTMISQLRDKANKGDQEAIDTLARYGVSLAEARNVMLSDVDVLRQLAQSSALAGASSAELFDLFGRAGPRLQGILRDLQAAGGIRIIDPEDVERIDEAEKSVRRFFQTLKVEGAGVLATMITGVKSYWFALLNPKATDAEKLKALGIDFGRALKFDDGAAARQKRVDNAARNAADAKEKAVTDKAAAKEEQLRIARQTPEERRAELTARLGRLKLVPGGERTGEQRERIADLELQLVRAKEPDKMESRATGERVIDSLARIGGFSAFAGAGGTSPMEEVADNTRRMVVTLEQMQREGGF